LTGKLGLSAFGSTERYPKEVGRKPHMFAAANSLAAASEEVELI
jgi:hypothetical protein